MSLLNRLKSALGGGASSAPPTVRSVVGRAYALNSVVLYAKTVAGSGVMPDELHSMTPDQATPIVETAATIAAKILGAAKKFGFLEFVSPAEAALLTFPFNKIENQQLIGATWRAEAFQVILWAISKIDTLPGLDQKAQDDLFQLLPLEQFNDIAAQSALRDATSIETARELAELWHWRSRTRQCIEESRPFPKIQASPGAPQLNSFDDVVRLTSKGLRETGLAIEAIDEDFKVRGKAFRDLSADEWSEIGSIIVERHFALNWLAGKAPGNRWDQTPTGT